MGESKQNKPVVVEKFTALMVGENHGLIGPFGSDFKGSPEHYRRITVYTHPAPAVAQEPVHFRAVLCGEQQDQAFGVVPKVVGFVDKKAAEQFILEKRDFQGWRYSLEPLYTEPTAVAVNEHLSERENAVLNFALRQFLSNAYLHMNAAAQDKEGKRYPKDASSKFHDDAKTTEALLERFERIAAEAAKKGETK